MYKQKHAHFGCFNPYTVLKCYKDQNTAIPGRNGECIVKKGKTMDFFGNEKVWAWKQQVREKKEREKEDTVKFRELASR